MLPGNINYSSVDYCRNNRILSKGVRSLRLSSDGNNNGISDFDACGTYRPFLSYAWNKLESSGLLVATEDDEPSASDSSLAVVPPDLSRNDAPAKGRGGNNQDHRVCIEVRGARGGKNESALRLARHALLHTVDTTTKTTVPTGIHVLNLVLFPRPSYGQDLPIFGADLVTLPGNRHLIAIDFQPVLTLNNNNDDDDHLDGDLRLPNEHLMERLKALHAANVQNDDDLPWGGDIPKQAKRYFSDYALWTRLAPTESDKAATVTSDPLEIVQTKVYERFVEYFDLYVDALLEATKNDNTSSQSITTTTTTQDDVVQGHMSYLNYRRKNDPARPMLKSLYGEEWTERLINQVLFKDITEDDWN